MNFTELLSVSLILFSVIDIIGSVPIIIDLRNKGHKIESAKAALVALILMSLFLYLGEGLLRLFNLDVESFVIAGSIILLLLGLEMILGITIFKDEPEMKSGSIVPLAFPLIAGAGSLTTILTLKAKYESINIQLGILVNIIFVYIVLKSSNWLGRILGKSGANILRKVFGIILLTIAVKLFKDNFHLMLTPPK